MIKHKLLSLFVALIATTALWASNTITYTASSKLSGYNGSLNVGATTFGPAITSHTFSNGTGTITCSGEITTIGDDAFGYCSSLTSVTIPNSVTTIGNDAFNFCEGLKSVTIPNSVTTIGDGAFFRCDSLTSVTIPNSVTMIGAWAFGYCFGLTSITIPNSVTTIGDRAFFECSGLTSITIPNSVTTIGDYAFLGCSGLTSVTIPNSVTTIGDYAFRLVNNIVYNGSATGSPWGAKCVNGYVDGYLVYSDATKTTLCGCFTNATGAITIPNSVTTIGDYAFEGCSGLTSVTIPNSVTTIGDCAFSGCSGLTSVTIPNSVTTIGDLAFCECSSLTSVTIPNSVTTIGWEAFAECSGLTSVTCYATNPPTCCYSFNGVDMSIPVYVPAQSVYKYKQANEWKTFTNIQPIGAEEVPVTDPIIAPDNHSVTITWPQTDNANTYTLEIKKNNELVCTLTFNSQGVMINITFAAPARGGERTSSNAEMTTNGYRFTVTGLEAGTDYTYAVTAKDASQQTLKTYSGEFTTTGSMSTGINGLTIDNGASAHSDKCTVRKFIRNNQLQIMRNDKLFNALGGEVR